MISTNNSTEDATTTSSIISYVGKKHKQLRSTSNSNATTPNGIVTNSISQHLSNNSNSSGSGSDDSSSRREIDAADTLVSLAASATNTPTVESKPFVSSTTMTSAGSGGSANTIEILLNTSNEKNQIVEKTIKLSDLTNSSSGSSSENRSAAAGSSNNKIDLVESACKLLIEQVLKSCPSANLASITIKTTASDAVASAASTTSPPSTTSSNEPTTTTTLTTIQLSDLKNGKQLNQELRNSNLSFMDNFAIGGTGDKDDDVVVVTTAKPVKRPRLTINHITDENNNNNKPVVGLADTTTNISLSENQQSADHLINKMTTNAAGSVRKGPTLATGRKSKDTELPPEEAKKRDDRREKNKQAAAKCRKKREDLTKTLSGQVDELNRIGADLKTEYQTLLNQKMSLESLLHSHEKNCTQKQQQLEIGSNKVANEQHQSVSVRQLPVVAAPVPPQHKNVKEPLKMEKEHINEIIQQSRLHPPPQQQQQPQFLKIVTTPSGGGGGNPFMSNSTTLTPLSGHLESFLAEFDRQSKQFQQQQQQQSVNQAAVSSPSVLFTSHHHHHHHPSVVSLQRPNNLKISNATNNNSPMLSPSPAAYAYMAMAISQQQQEFQQNNYPLLINSGSVIGNINNNGGTSTTTAHPLNTPLFTLTPLDGSSLLPFPTNMFN